MALIKCNHCGNTVSDRAVKCPHCGKNPKETAVKTPDVIEEEDTPSGSGKTLAVIVVVLAVIAIGFGGYMWLGSKPNKTEAVPVDTVAVDTTNCGDVLGTDTPEVVTEEPAVEADTVSYDTEQRYTEEQGFCSNTDVRDFVIGNSYFCNGVTLRITEDGVFANDNEISQSRPVFRKLSSETGRITARPSISITVKRGDNKLVDNKSGDVYDFQY